MPRYHFEIVDGIRIEDPVGIDLKTEAQAMELAENIARQIAIDVGPTSARKVVVVDDGGQELHKVPIAKPRAP
jgi:hypothetical protein